MGGYLRPRGRRFVAAMVMNIMDTIFNIYLGVMTAIIFLALLFIVFGPSD